MATIRKRGSKYHVQIRRRGTAPITGSFHLLTDAREWARQKERQIDRRELGPSRQVLKTLTLGELVERYRDTVVPRLRGAAKETVILNAFLRHPICQRTLSQLTTADFSNYRDERLQVVSSATLRRQLTPIARMFRVATEEWGLPVGESPLSTLQVRVVDHRRERRVLDGEYEKLLVSGRQARNKRLIPIIRFALATAMRRGEILALRWGEVDLHRRTATVSAAKNGHSRIIPLTDEALDALSLVTTEGIRPSDRVFSVTENAFRLGWQRLVRRAGKGVYLAQSWHIAPVDNDHIRSRF